MFQLDKIVRLRSTLESKDSQIKQTEWVVYFNWHAEGSQRLQDSKIDLLQKTNGEIKAQEAFKTKDDRTDVAPTALLYFSLPEFSQSTNFLSELLYYLSTWKRQLNSYLLK